MDNAATSFPKPEQVYEALDYANRNLAFNAGRGGYKGAKEAQMALDTLKDLLCNMVNISKNKDFILLTESATIASNILINGVKLKKHDVIYISPFEHNAIVRPLELLRKNVGFEIKVIPFKDDLNLDVEEFKYQLSLNPATHLFITLVSNVLGNVIDTSKIVDLCVNSKPVVIVDAAQALGLVNIEFEKLKCDYMIFASHKTLYGPLGLGGIISKRINKLEPIFAGGTGTDSLNTQIKKVIEVGSPNIVAIKGLLESINWINNIGQAKIRDKVRMLMEYAIDKLEMIDEVTIYSSKLCEKTGIIAITHDEYSPDEFAGILDDEFGIAVRSGYQCAPFIHQLIGTKDIGGVVRISLGYFNERTEIDVLIEAVEKLSEL